jgi:RNA polymerase sigma factor (sigma-70 family)
MPWAEVDDMIQHGVLVTLELRERYEPERGVEFPIYIKPRVFGSMVDMSRQNGSIKRSENAYINEFDFIDEISAVDILIKVENINLIVEAIESLPAEERTVISLFYYDEVSNKDIAVIMNITEVSATRWRKKALAALAEAVTEKLSREGVADLHEGCG